MTTKLPYNQRQLGVLYALTKRKKKDCRKILTKFDSTTVNLIADIARNLLDGLFPMREPTRKKLFKHKQNLVRLANRKISLNKRRIIIQQIGSAILPLLIPLISGLVARLFK